MSVTNPGQTLPNLHKLFDPGVRDPDKFLIVSDVYPTATTRAADLVLPSAMWVEKNGMFGNSERRTQQWFKMVDPPGQAKGLVHRQELTLSFEPQRRTDTLEFVEHTRRRAGAAAGEQQRQDEQTDDSIHAR